MRPPPPILTAHRRARARAIAWLRLALTWVVAALNGDAAPDRRHIRRRYGWLSLDPIVRAVCALSFIRAVELARLPVRRRRALRNGAPPGFRCRTVLPVRVRLLVGARLRRHFQHADVQVRIARMFAALANLDRFARTHLLKRVRRGLTRLFGLRAVRPRPHAFTSAAAHPPQIADSS